MSTDSAPPRRPRAGQPWSVLRDDDGPCAIVVPNADTPPHEALCEALGQVHGTGVIASHPLILEAVAGVKVQEWRSCTKRWKEAELGFADDIDQDWFAPHGDGRRSIFVLPLDMNLHDLGDAIEAHDEEGER